MEKRKLSSILEITPQTYVCLAVVLLLIPLRWVSAWLLAMVIHEMCHLGMIYFTEGNIASIRISSMGAKICPCPMPAWKEMICAAAGPIGSLLLVFTAKWLPCVAICGLLQALWNLIPLHPLDGGRIIRCLLRMLFPRCADRFAKWIQMSVVCLLGASCILVTILFRTGIVPMIVLVGLLLKSDTVKFPCKRGQLRVQ